MTKLKKEELLATNYTSMDVLQAYSKGLLTINEVISLEPIDELINWFTNVYDQLYTKDWKRAFYYSLEDLGFSNISKDDFVQKLIKFTQSIKSLDLKDDMYSYKLNKSLVNSQKIDDSLFIKQNVVYDDINGYVICLNKARDRYVKLEVIDGKVKVTYLPTKVVANLMVRYFNI